jgi:hypothetical protein
LAKAGNEERESSSVNTRIIAPLVGIAAFLIRFLSLGAIENDHYVYLARAHQVLYGDWPVRDFVDPGMPLAYLLSAAAAAAAGPTLLTEAVLSLAVFAIAAAATYALVRRASGSAVVAVFAVAILLVVPPRLYNPSKILVPVMAIALAWAYTDRPTARRAAALGAWTGVAFLFRHDYAAYVIVAAGILVIVRHWGDWNVLTPSIGVYAGVAAAVVMPWLIYVHVQQGLPEYLASAMRFSVAERTRTVSGLPLVFYATAAVPLAAFAVGMRGTRHLTPAHVVFATVLVFAFELVLLRDRPGARLSDVSAMTAIAAAIIVGRFLSAPQPRRADATPPIILTAALITVAGIALISVRSSIPSVIPNVVSRWQQVSSRLSEARPEIMPDPERAPLVRFIERCTDPGDRVLVGGAGPELPVLAHRAFAGGVPDWIRGYYEDPADVGRARAQLAQERVDLAVMLDGGDAFTASWPAVADDLRKRGLVRYEMPLTSRPVELWLRPSTVLDGATQLPCEWNN